MKNESQFTNKIDIQAAERDYAGQKERSCRKFIKPIFPVVSLFSKIASIIFPNLFDRSHYDITFYTVQSERIGSPFRAVHLSDLHNSVFGQNNDQFVEDIRYLAPDVIFITGDMIITDDNDYSIITSLLSRLIEKCKVPVYYIYGNHEDDEISVYGNKLTEDIAATGTIILDNELVSTELKGNEVVIGGLNIRFGETKKDRTRKMLLDLQSSSKYRILLEHYPHYFLELEENDAALDIDLALTGHAHGGVVRIPRIGSLYAPEQGFFPKFTEGVRAFGNSLVIASRGLGGRQFPPRVNNRPEIVIIDILPKDNIHVP